MRLFLLIFAFAIVSANAQYRRESWDLKPGWTAIYLNVDPGNDPLGILLAANPDITDVWQWRPNGLDPSLNAISAGTGADEWKVWRRGDVANSTFAIMSPNAAYLVRTKLTSLPQTLSFKGIVVAPRVQWRTDGLNLVGFPIKSGTTPQLNRYLGGAGIIGNNTEAYRYVGGDLDSNNPVLSPARLINAKRGEAFWIRSDKYSDFYGPVQVDVALDSGLNYGTGGSLNRVVLRNRTDREIVVTLAPAASEAPPGGGPIPLAPLLTTRERNDEGFYLYSPLGAGLTVTLPAGEARGIALGVDRATMGGSPGDQFAGLLKVTDAEGYSEIYLPVTAEKTSLAGLWIGEARITQVQNQLQRFQRGDDGDYLVDDDGKYLPEYQRNGAGEPVLDGAGEPIPLSDQELNDTAQTFKLKILVHVDAAGNAKLLSRAYAGIISDDGEGATLAGITTQESLLHADHLKTAVRLSCSHLPGDLVNPMSGTLAPGAMLSCNVVLGANDSSNPFLHTYHPDHDNKDARFENILPSGIESHQVERAITLTVKGAAGPGEGPQWGSTLLSGVYSETITGIHKQAIATSGIFALGKVSDISVLQTP
ncbi:hypothetical protein N9191_01740 [bacterium]|nr:hypothetical protein [bacterium]